MKLCATAMRGENGCLRRRLRSGMRHVASAFAAIIFAIVPNSVRAETDEIVVAQQYGVSFLPLVLMEKQRLVEKHAIAAGLPNLKVKWVKVAGPSIMNDGLISGAIHFAAQGAPSMILLWDKTRGQIRGVAAMTTYPVYLVSRNPTVKTVRDFSAADKIAVPSIKISTQAILLQMAAADAFGEKNYTRLDPYTVALSHPDAVLAFKNNTAGVNAHYSTSPFYEEEMKIPGARLITTNYETLGGPATAVLITASGVFRDANPRTYGAFLKGLGDAIDIINEDKRKAAQLYLDATNDARNTVESIARIIEDKDYAFTLRTQKVLKTAQFMAKIGTISRTPSSIEDLLFPETRALRGD